jgi:hypothetical protein
VSQLVSRQYRENTSLEILRMTEESVRERRHNEILSPKDERMRGLAMLSALILAALTNVCVGQAPLGLGRPVSREDLFKLNAPPDGGLRTLSIVVDQRTNPLKKVAQKVSEELGIAVAYEEAAWVSAQELMRAVDSPDNILKFTAANRATWDPNWRSAAVGSVHVTADYRVGEEYVFARDILLKAMDDHARRGNPGQFRLVDVGKGYSIVPANIRDEQGDWASTSSPLDARISLPLEKRSLEATLLLIAQAVTDTTRQRVSADNIRDIPGLNSVYVLTSTNIDARNEVAREVLARALGEVSVRDDQYYPFWWDLEYFPDAKTYRLSFYPVHRTGPSGEWLPATRTR